MNDVKVLVVDDDANTLRMLEVALRLEDFVEDVLVTGSLREAVDMCADFNPDVIILDSMGRPNDEQIGSRLKGVAPRAVLVSFSGAEERPEWADESIVKDASGLERLVAVIARAAGIGGVRGDALGEFLHELRNPIGAITGFVHLLQTRGDRLTDAQRDNIIDGIARGVERLSGIVAAVGESRRSK